METSTTMTRLTGTAAEPLSPGRLFAELLTTVMEHKAITPERKSVVNLNLYRAPYSISTQTKITYLEKELRELDALLERRTTNSAPVSLSYAHSRFFHTPITHESRERAHTIPPTPSSASSIVPTRPEKNDAKDLPTAVRKLLHTLFRPAAATTGTEDVCISTPKGTVHFTPPKLARQGTGIQ